MPFLLRVLRASAVNLLICARNHGLEIRKFKLSNNFYLSLGQGFTPAGDADARANVVFGPFIDRQCFWGPGRKPGVEMLMHSGLINSGLPNPSSGHVSGGEGELSVAAALCQTLTPSPSPSQVEDPEPARRGGGRDPSPKTPQPGPSSSPRRLVRSGVDPRPKPPPDPLELIAAGQHSIEVAEQCPQSAIVLEDAETGVQVFP